MSLIKDYIKYLNKCLKPYHALKENINYLEKEAFKKINI